MRYWIIALSIFIQTTTMAQQKAYDVTKDSANGSLVFCGKVTYADLTGEATFNWMHDGYDDYKPNPAYTAYLTENLPKYSLTVFLGTWCDDSHYWVPKLFKLLQTIGYPTEKVELYGVDRHKQTKNGEQAKYNLTLVPAIIVLKDGKEVGRITESPQNGLEADLQQIISK